MKPDLSPHPGSTERRKILIQRILLLVLLLAVPALSTMAKTNWYLPPGSAGHHLTAAVKMKAAHPPVIAQQQPVLPAGFVLPVTAEPPVFRPVELETFPLATAFSIDFQHRSPPARL